MFTGHFPQKSHIIKLFCGKLRHPMGLRHPVNIEIFVSDISTQGSYQYTGLARIYVYTGFISIHRDTRMRNIYLLCGSPVYSYKPCVCTYMLAMYIWATRMRNTYLLIHRAHINTQG